MSKYFTKTGIMLIAGVCFIAGAGFIGSIVVFKQAYDQTQLEMTYKAYEAGVLKEVNDAKVVKDADNTMYVIINKEVHEVKK